jgi:hypothetical protein
MRRGTGAVRLTVQALQLTALSLLLGSLRSLLLLGSLGSLLLLGLLGLLLRRKPLLRSAQPWLIWARLRGRSPGRLIRLSPRRCLYARPLLLHILR